MLLNEHTHKGCLLLYLWHTWRWAYFVCRFRTSFKPGSWIWGNLEKTFPEMWCSVCFVQEVSDVTWTMYYSVKKIIIMNHTCPVKLFHAPLGEEHKILSTFHGILNAPKAPMYFVIQDILSISQSIILHTERKFIQGNLVFASL